MKLRKIIDEIFDEIALKKEIQTAENLSNQHTQTIGKIKDQINDLEKEKFEKEKEEQRKAKQQQLDAVKAKKVLAQTELSKKNGITTHQLTPVS